MPAIGNVVSGIVLRVSNHAINNFHVRIINVFTMMQSVMVLMIVEISVTKKIAKVIRLIIKI